MKIKSEKIVLCSGVRTVIGHISKSLAEFSAEELLKRTLEELLKKSALNPEIVDGVITGWVGQGSSAPNIARVAALNAGLAEKSHALTIQTNCISGIESVCSAARHIFVGEGEVYMAGGTESMSNFPYTIRGPRSNKYLRSLETIGENWEAMSHSPEIEIRDSIEEGLTDPVKHINMAGTAEVCAQMYGISKEAQDAYAYESYKRCLEAEKNGFYKTHSFSVGKLEQDEYPFLRQSLVEKPNMLGKAPYLFDAPTYPFQKFYETYGHFISNKTYEAGKTLPTVTVFNSCARSDGAAALIVTSERKAKELNLEILAELDSWAFLGNNPAYMGVAPTYTSQLALQRAGISFDQLDHIELHEAFAATCLSIFKIGKENYQQDWQSKFDKKLINPNGGTLALGHPLAATGTRVILNALYAMKANPEIKWALATACAAGGLGGAVVLKKYA